MDTAVLDRTTGFATETLASEDAARIGGLVRVMALRWPRERALSISFALTSAAAEMEDLMADRSHEGAASRAYKMAALVAADVLAIEASGIEVARGKDLLHYWRRADPY